MKTWAPRSRSCSYFTEFGATVGSPRTRTPSTTTSAIASRTRPSGGPEAIAASPQPSYEESNQPPLADWNQKPLKTVRPSRTTPVCGGSIAIRSVARRPRRARVATWRSGRPPVAPRTQSMLPAVPEPVHWTSPTVVSGVGAGVGVGAGASDGAGDSAGGAGETGGEEGEVGVPLGRAAPLHAARSRASVAPSTRRDAEAFVFMRLQTRLDARLLRDSGVNLPTPGAAQAAG